MNWTLVVIIDSYEHKKKQKIRAKRCSRKSGGVLPGDVFGENIHSRVKFTAIRANAFEFAASVFHVSTQSRPIFVHLAAIRTTMTTDWETILVLRDPWNEKRKKKSCQSNAANETLRKIVASSQMTLSTDIDRVNPGPSLRRWQK